VEQHAISVAPSASVYIGTHARSGGVESVVAVSAGKSLSNARLPESTAEAEQIARLYPRSILLQDEGATADSFFRSAASADVIHFAGHALDNDAASGPALVLGSDESHLLRASDIAQHELNRHPVVVLSACSTARGRLRRNEGVDSLAYAFMQAGARTVVATLWDVDDAASAELFAAYHRGLRRGEMPPNALRSAQLHMLHSDNPSFRQPSSWAAAVLIGSV
jgi:CHAT domain-containing protein